MSERTCIDCKRPMISQPIYNTQRRWRDGGYVRHGAGERCNGCYSAARRGGTCRPKTRFPATAVRIEPTYPVVCDTCGPVGEPHDTREAADRARQAHINWHRLPASVQARKNPTSRGGIAPAELERLRRLVGAA